MKKTIVDDLKKAHTEQVAESELLINNLRGEVKFEKERNMELRIEAESLQMDTEMWEEQVTNLYFLNSFTSSFLSI